MGGQLIGLGGLTSPGSLLMEALRSSFFSSYKAVGVIGGPGWDTERFFVSFSACTVSPCLKVLGGLGGGVFTGVLILSKSHSEKRCVSLANSLARPSLGGKL